MRRLAHTHAGIFKYRMLLFVSLILYMLCDDKDLSLLECFCFYHSDFSFLSLWGFYYFPEMHYPIMLRNAVARAGLWGELHHLLRHVSHVLSQITIIGFGETLAEWSVSCCSGSFTSHTDSDRWCGSRSEEVGQWVLFGSRESVRRTVPPCVRWWWWINTLLSPSPLLSVLIYLAFCFFGNTLARFHSPEASEKRNSPAFG